jgi:hypothetical protein
MFIIDIKPRDRKLISVNVIVTCCLTLAKIFACPPPFF